MIWWIGESMKHWIHESMNSQNQWTNERTIQPFNELMNQGFKSSMNQWIKFQWVSAPWNHWINEPRHQRINEFCQLHPPKVFRDRQFSDIFEVQKLSSRKKRLSEIEACNHRNRDPRSYIDKTQGGNRPRVRIHPFSCAGFRPFLVDD